MNAKQAVYDVIRGAIANHPRSLQKRIGPSEIGTPCDRRIGYKLLGQDENPRGDAWKPTVGTAVHGWLEKALEDANLAQVIADRILADERVDAVTVALRKLRPPVPHQLDPSGVRIRRTRAGA